MIGADPALALTARRMTGRCATGAERDGGTRWHAVPTTSRFGPSWERALCGAKPGRRGNGWSAEPGDAVTCPRCRAAANRTTTTPMTSPAKETTSMGRRRNERPVKPADTAHAGEWDDYDKRVIVAFLREATAKIDAGHAVPFTTANGRAVLGWLRARLGEEPITRGARA